MTDVLKYRSEKKEVEVAWYYKGEGKWKYLEGNLKTKGGKELKKQVKDGKEEYEKSVSSVVETPA